MDVSPTFKAQLDEMVRRFTAKAAIDADALAAAQAATAQAQADLAAANARIAELEAGAITDTGPAVDAADTQAITEAMPPEPAPPVT